VGNKNSNFSFLGLCLKMATTLFSSFSLHSIRLSSSTLPSSSSSSPSFLFCTFPLRTRTSSLKAQTVKKRVVKAVEEETQQELIADESEEPSTSEQQPVVVPVSPSDTLTMFFQVHCIFFLPFLRQFLVQLVLFGICSALVKNWTGNFLCN